MNFSPTRKNPTLCAGESRAYAAEYRRRSCGIAGVAAVRNALQARIETTAARLDQLRARVRLVEQAEKARARKLAKRERAKTLAALLRSADAHRKIVLGGVVIAAGADDLDPAELCGWLLSAMVERKANPTATVGMREAGLQHFESRERDRGQPPGHAQS